MAMTRQLSILAGALTLCGCAGISVTQLNVDGSAKSKTPNGAVYFLPKPYLLVTRLPATAGPGGLPSVFHTAGSDSHSAGAGAGGTQGGTPGAPKPAEAAKGGDSAKEGGGDNPAPAGSGSGSSFDARTTDYVVKLIYLPDREHPMSITASTGLFGTAKLSPTFQDGWMLTGFESEADNKVAEVLEHLGSVITSLRAPGGGGDNTGAGAAPGAPTDILKPGLYEFRYDASGHLLGLCAVNYFSSQGTTAPTGYCLGLQ